jgi:hypothetical protein
MIYDQRRDRIWFACPPIVHRNVILRVLVRRKRTLCQLLWHLFFLKDLVRDHHKLQQSDLKQIFHRVSVTNREGWIDVPRMLQNFRMSPESHSRYYQN